MPPLLEVKQLHTEFRTGAGLVRAVDGVTFSVEQGETVAVVGESGSGKSVTALSILRLVADPPGRITAGEVLFDGRDLLGLADAEMREIRGRDIGMVFQEPMTSLNPVLTIGRQITESLEQHLGTGANAFFSFSSKSEKPSLARECMIECSATRPASFSLVASGSASQAARISANSVWPPIGGIERACSIEQ